MNGTLSSIVWNGIKLCTDLMLRYVKEGEYINPWDLAPFLKDLHTLDENEEVYQLVLDETVRYLEDRSESSERSEALQSFESLFAVYGPGESSLPPVIQAAFDQAGEL